MVHFAYACARARPPAGLRAGTRSLCLASRRQRMQAKPGPRARFSNNQAAGFNCTARLGVRAPLGPPGSTCGQRGGNDLMASGLRAVFSPMSARPGQPPAHSWLAAGQRTANGAVRCPWPANGCPWAPFGGLRNNKIPLSCHERQKPALLAWPSMPCPAPCPALCCRAGYGQPRGATRRHPLVRAPHLSASVDYAHASGRPFASPPSLGRHNSD